MSVTELSAAELLEKQLIVQAMEAAAVKAFNAIHTAKQEVKRLEDEHSEARWRAEEGRRELRELEAALLAETDNQK
jgi:hypothetical protein